MYSTGGRRGLRHAPPQLIPEVANLLNEDSAPALPEPTGTGTGPLPGKATHATTRPPAAPQLVRWTDQPHRSGRVNHHKGPGNSPGWWRQRQILDSGVAA
ncbi:hypothetical protein GCM10010169_34630 [Micromonospora fulviviridis]|nr:hypothetical protein GCM10010169_34630 [Micromonospora fulviviridis]